MLKGHMSGIGRPGKANAEVTDFSCPSSLLMAPAISSARGLCTHLAKMNAVSSVLAVPHRAENKGGDPHGPIHELNASLLTDAYDLLRRLDCLSNTKPYVKVSVIARIMPNPTSKQRQKELNPTVSPLTLLSMVGTPQDHPSQTRGSQN